MEPFMIAAIATGLFFAFRNIVNKYAIANHMRAIAWFYFFSAINIITLPIISWIISPITLPSSSSSWVLMIFASTAGFLGTLIFIYALTLGDVTTGMPVLSTRPIFIVPLSFIFLGEFYGYGVIGWIILIVFGAIMTSWSEEMKLKDLYMNKALRLFFASTILWALMNISSKPVLQEIDNFNFISWYHVFNAPLLLFFMPFILNKNERIDIKKHWKSTLPYAILGNMFFYASFLSMFFAVKFSVSLSEALIATQGVFTVAIGFLLSQISPKLLAEKNTNLTYLFRALGAILILIGTYHILT